MSDETVREIVETRIQDNWALTEVAWDNIKYVPKRGTSFIAPLLSEVDSERKGIKCVKRHYSLIIEVRTPKNKGTATISNYCEILKNLFEGYSEENFSCIKGRTERVGGSSKQWHQRNVVLECRYYDYS